MSTHLKFMVPPPVSAPRGTTLAADIAALVFGGLHRLAQGTHSRSGRIAPLRATGG